MSQRLKYIHSGKKGLKERERVKAAWSLGDYIAPLSAVVVSTPLGQRFNQGLGGGNGAEGVT